MTEQPKLKLPQLLQILWSARINASCDQWHLVNRALPPLKTLAADDAQLRQAVDHATAAVEHMDALLTNLRAAVDLIGAGERPAV